MYLIRNYLDLNPKPCLNQTLNPKLQKLRCAAAARPMSLGASADQSRAGSNLLRLQAGLGFGIRAEGIIGFEFYGGSYIGLARRNLH